MTEDPQQVIALLRVYMGEPRESFYRPLPDPADDALLEAANLALREVGIQAVRDALHPLDFDDEERLLYPSTRLAALALRRRDPGIVRAGLAIILIVFERQVHEVIGMLAVVFDAMRRLGLDPWGELAAMSEGVTDHEVLRATREFAIGRTPCVYQVEAAHWVLVEDETEPFYAPIPWVEARLGRPDLVAAAYDRRRAWDASHVRDPVSGLWRSLK